MALTLMVPLVTRPEIISLFCEVHKLRNDSTENSWLKFFSTITPDLLLVKNNRREMNSLAEKRKELQSLHLLYIFVLFCDFAILLKQINATFKKTVTE